MKNYLLKLFSSLILGLISLNSVAQNTNLPVFIVKTNFKTVLNADLKDTTGKYGSNEFAVGLNIPVYRHHFINKENRSGFYGISILNNNTYIAPKIGFLSKTNSLFNLSLGADFIYFTGNKNYWLFKLSSNLFEDEFSISDPKPRFSGDILFVRSVNHSFSYHLGLAYRYSFGLASFLPVAGLKYNFADKWKLIISLPYLAEMEYKANKRLCLSAKIHPAGAISHYSNNTGIFGQAQNIILFRKRVNIFSVNTLYRMNSNVCFKGEIGREGNRKIFFSDIKSGINKEPLNYFTSGINNAWFVNLGIVLRLQKTQKIADNGEDILDEFDNELNF